MDMRVVRQRIIVVLLLLVGLQLSVLLCRRASPPESAATDLFPTEVEALGKVSMGLRRAVANVLWIKVDRYLHTGALTRIILKEENTLTSEPIQAGFSAEMMAKELFPLMRLIVLLDPRFVKAGTTAGIHLIKMGKKREGKDFIQDLIRYNKDHPRVYMLYNAIGNTLWIKQVYQECRPYLRAAVQLFPRVYDDKLLQKYNEPPTDSMERLSYRGMLAALVHTAVLAEDYEEALHYWLKSGEFAPSNVYTKVIAEYVKMKRSGAVDKEELAFRLREWQADDQRREKERDEAEKAARKKEPKKPVQQPAPAPGTTEVQEGNIRYFKTERQTTVVDIEVTTPLMQKLGTIGAIIIVAMLLGVRRRWLTQ